MSISKTEIARPDGIGVFTRDYEDQLEEATERVTKVSASWFLEQSDACQKCKSTFDIEPSNNTRKTEELRQIAENLDK